MNSQKKHAGMFLLIGLLLLTTNTFSRNPNFHIYICFGQSNMEGQGAIETQDRTVNSRFKVLQAIDCSDLKRTKGTWYPAIPPLCQCATGLSPADYFGRTMVEHLPDSITVGVINVSVGGCDIRLFDKDVCQNYDSTYNEEWYLSHVRLYDWKPRQRLMDMAKLAQKDGVIKGILLHQGEANLWVDKDKWPSYVKKVYNDMLTELSLKADSVPLLAGEVLYTGVYSEMNPTVRTLPNIIPTAHVISAEGLAGDWAHFTSAGYRILGLRYAAAMLPLLGVKEKVLEPEAYNFEAECSTVGSNWNEIHDVTASNNSYLTIKTGFGNTTDAPTDIENAISFDFTAKSDTTFFVYARLNCPTVSKDSYWVKMDNGPFEYINGLTTSVWKWLKLKSYNLKAGNHTLAIAGGEEGAKLDKVFISNFDNVPTGMGDPAIRICNNTVYKVPSKIEAELFLDQNGVQTEGCGDTGGGLDVGSIDANDWMQYTIDVAADTVYNATFRCASPGTGGAVSVLVDGVKISTMSFTGTGNWQIYKSFSKDIPLKAGKHILKLLVTTGGFNFNWFMFEYKKVSGINDLKEGGLSVFPNPTNGVLNIDSDAFQFNNVNIIDCTGKRVYSKNVDSSKRISFNPCLQKGLYILRLSDNTKTQNIKIIIN
ncbi:sialate O-acetylesterase [Flavobacterium sp. UBA6031]|uniref:sialate O-acetylesterase n=1 Tax=Flavobacterium sp. UBA6031 TaxID=1946551 RepID=UPI0032E385DB